MSKTRRARARIARDLRNDPDQPMLAFTLSVPVHPLSVAFVRKAVQAVAEVKGDETAEMLALLFTELVTNAIRHSGLRPSDHIDVAFDLGGSGARGEVVDCGRGFELEGEHPRPHGEGGFGLFILDKVASNWGVESDRDMTRVWFEV